MSFRHISCLLKIYFFRNKREKCSDSSGLDEAGSLQSKCADESFLKSILNWWSVCVFSFCFPHLNIQIAALIRFYFCDSLPDDCQHSHQKNQSQTEMGKRTESLSWHSGRLVSFSPQSAVFIRMDLTLKQLNLKAPWPAASGGSYIGLNGPWWLYLRTFNPDLAYKQQACPTRSFP